LRLPAVILLFLLGSCTAAKVVELPPQVEQVERVERTITLTLPQKCRHLEREPDPATWDAEKEEYPPNYEWENCMLVGRR